MRKYRRASTPGMRICNRCERELPLSLDVFVKDGSRASGIGYECLECMRARKLLRGERTDTWKFQTMEARELTKSRQNKYNSTVSGRARLLRHRYRKIDSAMGRSSDITVEFMIDLIQKPCAYCGDTEDPRGCDRIDNSRGHLMDNVVPACKACNCARQGHFTHEEGMILGRAIARIKAARRSKAA
jgi:hypothetical protein